MVKKSRVCLIDENDLVRESWKNTLGNRVEFIEFSDPFSFFHESLKNPGLASSFRCMVLSRLFSKSNLDILYSEIPARIRKQTSCPLFLNWQGHLDKDELEPYFSGKINHRYGIRWHTLRLQIKRSTGGTSERVYRCGTKASQFVQKPALEPWAHLGMMLTGDKRQRCKELLNLMASQAEGLHKDKIVHYAEKDPPSGVALLEAIYNRLVTTKNRPPHCPSHYINSSPVIAARILQEALIVPEA